MVFAAVIVAVFLLVILVVPFFVNADTFRPTVESQLSTAVGRNVTLGRLSFSLLAGSLVAEDIAIADDPAFSSVPFIQAKKLDVGIQVLPFLFHRDVRITKLNIDTPSIQLIQHANGKWNFSSIGGSSPPSAGAQQPGAPPNLTVAELKITHGSANVSSIPATAKPFEYSDVNLTVKQFSFAQSFPFDLSAKLPADGTLKLTGGAGPISQKDASQTPFKATLTLREFNPVAAGVIDQSKGISMVNDVDAQLTSDGTSVSSTGKIKASRLQLVPKGSPAQTPVNIDYAVSDNLNTRQGTVSDLTVHTGSVAVHLNGSFQFTPQALDLNLHLSAPGLPIEQLEQLLPVVGVRLPSGSSLQGGSLTANIAITGPATTATMTGPVEIDNTKLAGFDLGSKIQGLNPFGGTSSGTEIQVLKANLNSSPQGTHITDIYGNLPQIGSATGEGTVAPSGAIDFNLNAKLNSSNAVGAVANTAANAIGGLVGGFLHPKTKPTSDSNRGIPLTITGTATNPSIHANIGQLLR
jgi:AsmA protein